MRYFVIYTYINPDGADSEIGITRATKPIEALEFAKDHYRKTWNLPTSKHIFAKILFDSEDPELADQFYNALLDEIKKVKNEGSSDSEELEEGEGAEEGHGN